MAGTDSKAGRGNPIPEIVQTPDVLGGDPRIDGHRIGVYHVYQRYVEGGETPEEIATSYGITVAEVHAALAYAFSNPDEMRDIEARTETIADEHSVYRVVPEDPN
jgi:uncharacterized protein (DUF433 family)